MTHSLSQTAAPGAFPHVATSTICRATQLGLAIAVLVNLAEAAEPLQRIPQDPTSAESSVVAEQVKADTSDVSITGANGGARLDSVSLGGYPLPLQSWSAPRGTASAVDRDLDGIPDSREDSLLARFRPYYLFSTSPQGLINHHEPIRPADPFWYIARSELNWSAVEDGRRFGVYSTDALAADPTLILRAMIIGDEWGSSNLLVNPTKTKYYLNLRNSICEGYRLGLCGSDGNTWTQVKNKGNVGLFGHVSWYGPLIAIEYWQFFPYNHPGVFWEFGDHEGDWCVLKVLYDPEKDHLAKVFHFAHGKEMGFELLTTHGRVELDRNTIEVRGPNYSTASYEIDHKYVREVVQNNLLRLRSDPKTGRFEHPLVYIEYGGHEFWPSEHWSYESAPKHNGLGLQFMTSRPPNLGEVENPLSDTAKVIMQFNGSWGAWHVENDPPTGPPLHSEWTWSENNALRAALRNKKKIEDHATTWHEGPPVARIDLVQPLLCGPGQTYTTIYSAGRSYWRDVLGAVQRPPVLLWKLTTVPFGKYPEGQLLGRHVGTEVMATLEPGRRYVLWCEAVASWPYIDELALNSTKAMRSMLSRDSVVIEVPPRHPAPGGLSPNNAHCVSKGAELSWRPMGEGALYRVEVTTPARGWSDPVFVGYTSGTTSAVPDLVSGESYEWRVRLHDWSGRECAGLYSATANFEVAGVPPAVAPQIVSPPNGAVVTGPVRLEWRHVEGVSEFLVEVGCGSGGQFSKQRVSGDSVDVDLASGSYTWRVSGLSSCGESGASSPLSTISVSAGQCTQLQLLDMQDTTVCLSAGDTVRWTGSALDRDYVVTLRTGVCWAEEGEIVWMHATQDTQLVVPELGLSGAYGLVVSGVYGNCGCAVYPYIADCRSVKLGGVGCRDGGEEVGGGMALNVGPNPAHEAVAVMVSMREAGRADLAVYDLAGRRVRSLETMMIERGEHRFVWDGSWDGSGAAKSGVYVIVLRVGDAVLRRKIFIVR